MSDSPNLADPYLLPVTGAFEVHGELMLKYIESGEEHVPLGYPIYDEREGPVAGARTSYF